MVLPISGHSVRNVLAQGAFRPKDQVEYVLGYLQNKIILTNNHRICMPSLKKCVKLYKNLKYPLRQTASVVIEVK